LLITEGDILVPTPPAGPLPPPTILIPGSGPGSLGIIPTGGGFNELDALSYGTEPLLQQNNPKFWYFSVDRFAVGLPGVPFPSVTTEGALVPGEAAADVYTAFVPIAPSPPAPGLNTGVYDGNGGITPFASPTLNLVEPTPVPLVPPRVFAELGDNLDGLDIDTPPAFIGPIAFSLDSSFPDPLKPPGAPPPNTGTASANGFSSADILVSAPGGAPALYAPAAMLGLDFDGGEGGTDDVDGLILRENGTGIYEPVTAPYSWLDGTDELLFSVRRGSAIIGAIDAILGIPIEEGDILVPVFDVVNGSPVQDGAEGDFDVGIFVPAENIGLATVRSGTGMAWGVPNPDYGGVDMWADDLDALDVTTQFIPEPVGISMLMFGLIGWVRRRR
jgi:hypothetical protein